MNAKTNLWKCSWIRAKELWAAATGMLLLPLLTLPAVAQAQSYTNSYGIWTYTTANDTITITEYAGPGGDVTIPDSINGLLVTTIGGYYDADWDWWGAFEDCTSLTNVTIGNSVTNLGSPPFLGCQSLAAIMVDALNPAYSSVNGVLFEIAEPRSSNVRKVLGKVGSYTVPNSVSNIGGLGVSIVRGSDQRHNRGPDHQHRRLCVREL